MMVAALVGCVIIALALGLGLGLGLKPASKKGEQLSSLCQRLSQTMRTVCGTVYGVRTPL
jgi:fumarate reductase subunit D